MTLHKYIKEVVIKNGKLVKAVITDNASGLDITNKFNIKF